jgi:Protein of unknown function (DUF1579)
MRINSTRDYERQGDRLLLIWTGMRCAIAALLVIGLTAVSAHAQDNVLEKFVGRWNVRVKMLQPQQPDITYIETYEWMLDRKFVRARTEGKTDGTEDMVVGSYDPKANGYPFWIFSSTGTFLQLAPGTWDARNRTMEWKSPLLLDVSYQARCMFPDDNTRRCTLVIKNWLGKVLQEQDSSAVRRND